MSLPVAPAAQALPDLCRVCILGDARTKATFSDNTIVVVNSTGSSFLVISPDGRSTRQLSEYALNRHSPLLAAVLEFRNMHVELPCFCKPLARVLRPSFTLGYLIRDATWPCPLHAVETGLAQLQPDGKVAVSSEDGVAQVVLHGHQRRFAVCYPLLVAERPQEAKYEYVWQTQVFSVASHPARWQPAVRAVLQAAEQLGQPVGAAQALLDRQESQSSMELPTSHVGGSPLNPDGDPLPTRHEGSDCSMAGSSVGGPGSADAPSCRRSVLPRADDCTRSGLAEQLRSDDWWGEPSLSLLPPEDVLLFEWTPDATYQFLPEGGEVEVWVHADESCLVSTRGGRFLAHYKDTSAGEQLYAANCVPDSVWSRDQACRYPLASLAAHALKLRAHNSTLEVSRAARLPAVPPDKVPAAGAMGWAPCVRGMGDDLFAVVSTVVLEESSLPGHGQFTAYEDGRVRVCFDDRTILHMAATRSHCKVVLPDGKAVVVAVDNPVGVEPYVAAAVEFACWAFKTPVQRSHELRLQARVRAEIANSQRMAHMCEFSATRALPPAVRDHAEDPSEAAMAQLAAAFTNDLGSLDRHTIIEKLLSENARLLQRL